jgi:hypothetical protein
MTLNLRLVSVFLVGALTACTTAPVQETKYFSQALTAANSAGQPLLDDLATAERQQGQQRAVRAAKAGTACAGSPAAPWQIVGNGGFIRGFCVTDAAYFSELTEPPATAQFRGALQVIQQYADALSDLAEGQSAAATRADVQTLAQNVAGLLSIASPVVSGALNELKPLLDQAVQAASADEERRLIKQGAPIVGKLIDSLRQATPAIFNTLIEEPAVRLTTVDLGQPTSSSADLNRIENYRHIIADYVVLLGKLGKAWEMLVAAVNQPDTISLADLAASSAQLNADADAIRHSLAALRRGDSTAH